MAVQTNVLNRPFDQTLRTISFKQIDYVTYERSCVLLYTKSFVVSLKSASRNCSTRESHLHRYNSRLLPAPLTGKTSFNHETNRSIVLEGNRIDASRQFLTQDVHFRSISLAKIEEDSLSMRRDATWRSRKFCSINDLRLAFFSIPHHVLYLVDLSPSTLFTRDRLLPPRVHFQLN